MRLGWVVALAAVWLAGCASLRGPAADATAAPPAAPPTSLEVEAPQPLKRLLERNLDLARVGTFSGGDAIDDTEWARLIDASPAQVRELVQTEGYFEPHVKLIRESDTGATQRRVRLELEPGPLTHVSRVTLEVEGELGGAADAGDARAQATLADLRKAWALPAGRAFRNPAWSDAKAAALARLRAAGYATASWNGTAAEIDAPAHEARLFLVAESGPLFRFGELNVEGLAAHDLETVRNLAAIAPGTPVSEALMLDYQDRLQKSGLFDSVTVTLDPDPERAAAAKVNVRLREAPLQVYTFGLGISANTGPRASAEHVYRRVFGYALTAHNKLEWGRLKQAWDGEISTHPGENLYRSLLGGTVERLESSTDVVLSQRLRLGRTQDTQRIERLYYVQAERSARTTFTEPVIRSNTLALSVNYEGVWRQLDSVVLPTEGFSLSLKSGVGRSHGNGEAGPYGLLYGRLTGYQPFGRAWYGQARIELGQVFKRETLPVPDSQLFRAGGDDSVRGYAYRSLAPVVDGAVSGGTSLLTASVEVARPLSDSMPSLWGAVFIDAGRAANGFKNLDPALGPGIGLRWRSPVGPLRLDFAWGRDVHKFRIHFSVGIAL